MAFTGSCLAIKTRSRWTSATPFTFRRKLRTSGVKVREKNEDRGLKNLLRREKPGA